MKPFLLQRTVEATTEPVSLAEAKEQLRILHSDDNAYVTALIVAAREAVEEACHIALVSQTWIAQYCTWDSSDKILQLLRPPTISVASVKYYDYDDTQQTVSPDDYVAELRANQVVLNASYIPPTLSPDRQFPIEVSFVAGYGDAPDVPSRAKQVILVLVHHFYENRTPAASIPKVRMPYSVDFLLASLKRRNA